MDGADGTLQRDGEYAAMAVSFLDGLSAAADVLVRFERMRGKKVLWQPGRRPQHHPRCQMSPRPTPTTARPA